MRIAFIEIANFRKILSARIDFSPETTLFVGANNSGKTSAMLALRRFLVEKGKFKTQDFTLSHWKQIDELGKIWQKLAEGTLVPLNGDAWARLMPTLDIWLEVEDKEIHYVSSLLPTLDWQGGKLGVRLRLEPKDIEAFYKDFRITISEADKMRGVVAAGNGKKQKSLTLWPTCMIDFLSRRLSTHFGIAAYVLDPSKLSEPSEGMARPQTLETDSAPLDGDPLKGLIRIDEINAQRGLGESDGAEVNDGSTSFRESRKLSDQLRSYYSRHLDPSERPVENDLKALRAIEAAQDAFDERLKVSFATAIQEVEGLGYPGVTDPKLRMATRLRTVDGLDHEAAVSFEIDDVGKKDDDASALRLPEGHNGLGYQNLISMVFRLMSFRDAWMRVGKAGNGDIQARIEPLHLVLVEEPEAHLHVQVQQVFIKKAYDVLRRHKDLESNTHLKTQLIVSTHSSHVAHETSFACLRYFRRLPAGMKASVPVSTIINLSEVFGDEDDTKRFVARYLKAQHADLFFADAAILVEGSAEKMLLPNLIREHHNFLNQCYISLLEISGSHAHTLQPLIEKLGILTLVITDLDAGIGGEAQQPERKKGQTSNNNTLKKWIPQISDLDNLLDLGESEKTRQTDALAAVRVAYQCPLKVQFPKGKAAEEALANTFEDSLVLQNPSFFSELQGLGLTKNVRETISQASSNADFGSKMFKLLRNGKKAEFALDILSSPSFKTVAVPAYIAEGLSWLEGKLKVKRVKVMAPTFAGKKNETVSES